MTELDPTEEVGDEDGGDVEGDESVLDDNESTSDTEDETGDDEASEGSDDDCAKVD